MFGIASRSRGKSLKAQLRRPITGLKETLPTRRPSRGAGWEPSPDMTRVARPLCMDHMLVRRGIATQRHMGEEMIGPRNAPGTKDEGQRLSEHCFEQVAECHNCFRRNFFDWPPNIVFQRSKVCALSYG